MPDKTEVDYDALAARLTDPEVPLAAPREVHVGEDAARFGREFLLREYGSEEALQEAMRNPGRPRVGAAQEGPSPVVRGAITSSDFAALTELMKSSGMKQSAIVREAVHEYLERRLAS